TSKEGPRRSLPPHLRRARRLLHGRRGARGGGAEADRVEDDARGGRVVHGRADLAPSHGGPGDLAGAPRVGRHLLERVEDPAARGRSGADRGPRGRQRGGRAGDGAGRRPDERREDRGRRDGDRGAGRRLGAEAPGPLLHGGERPGGIESLRGGPEARQGARRGVRAQYVAALAEWGRGAWENGGKSGKN